jgi:hypothetical protein
LLDQLVDSLSRRGFLAGFHIGPYLIAISRAGYRQAAGN